MASLALLDLGHVTNGRSFVSYLSCFHINERLKKFIALVVSALDSRPGDPGSNLSPAM
jgi:hypothetical protein